MSDIHAPQGERIGPSDLVGIANTVGELIAHLVRLNRPDLPIFSGRTNERGMALHRHAMVDPSLDYVSFTHIEHHTEPHGLSHKG
jgi:hypothetical protein